MSRNRNSGYRKNKSNGKDTTKEPSSASTKATNAETEVSRKESSEDTPEGKNDLEWYARDPRILEDAARIPFSYPTGKPFSSNTILANKADNHNLQIRSSGNYGVPGICTLRLSPSIGYAVDRLSPINVAANALYTNVRYVNSGRKNYDPNDLMMYCLTFAELYSMVLWLQRVYAYAFMYSQRNWYIGGQLLRANHINPDVIVKNLANFRYWLNALINKISAYAVPGDIHYFRRRAFLYANVYLENGDGNIKDQLYQFAPAFFWKFEYTNTNNSNNIKTSKLTRTSIRTVETQQDYEAWLSELSSFLDNVDGDEDFGIMSGDILKAYQTNILGVAQIPDDYTISPIYDPFVLAQFKNATVIECYRNVWNEQYWWSNEAFVNAGANYRYKCGDVFQDPRKGLIMHCYGIPTNASDNAFNDKMKIQTDIWMTKWLSVENPEPGIGDVAESTRLMLSQGKEVYYVMNATSPTANLWKAGALNALATGTEVVVEIEITQCKFNADGIESFDKNVLVHNVALRSFRGTTTYYDNLNQLSNVLKSQILGFKYAPTMYAATYAPGDLEQPDLSQYVSDFIPLSNLDNVTPIDSDVLARLHEACILSMFFVPGVARMISG